MPTSDLTLLRKWASEGDAEAFKEIASRYAAMVYATCNRVLGNAAEAEDVAQECFEILAQRRQGPKSHLGAWLHKVATNRAIDRVKADKRRKDREARFVAERRSASEIQWDDIYAYVDEAVAALPEKLRVPIVLHFFESQTHETIAEAIGTSRATVTYRIAKGIEEIRKLLKRRGVVAPTAVLASLLAKHLAAEAAPAALTSALGKIAIAGEVKAVADGALLVSGGVKAVGGLLVLKKAGIVVAGIMAIGLVWWGQTQRRPPETPEPPVSLNPAGLNARTTPPGPSGVAQEPVLVPAEPYIAGGDSDSPVPPFIAGIVLDGEGNPVAGALVQARLEKERYLRFEPTPHIAAQTKTGPDGAFVLAELPPEEKLLVVVTHPEWAVCSGLVRPLGETEARDGVECRFKAGVSPRGRVVTESGAPVPGAEVAVSGLYPEEYFDIDRDYGSYYKHLDFGVLCSVQTDENGEFILPRLDPECAIWGLSARAPGFARNFAYSEELSEAEAEAYSDSVRTNWRASFLRVYEEGIVITLSGGGGFAGRVIEERTDRPVSGAFVSVEGYIDPPRGWMPEIIWQNARTNEDGTYRMGDLPAGRYKTLAVHGDLMSEAIIVNVGVGEMSDDINFKLAPPASLSGVVYDSASGEPLARMSVFLSESGMLGMSTSATTDAYGRYRFDRLHPGDWRIMTGGGHWQIDLSHHGTPIPEIELRADGTKELDLYMVRRQPAGEVRVSVVDAYGRPISQAEVMLDWQHGSTNQDGELVFKRVKPGSHRVGVRDPATGLLAMEIVEVVAGEETFAQIVPHMPSGVIDGHVLDPDGNPAEGSLTVTFSVGGTLHLTAAVDENGAYTSGALPPGRIVVRVRDPEREHIWEPIERDLRLEANETITDVDFVIRLMTGRVAGVVRYPDGAPAVGKTLELHGWGLQKYEHTDGHGRFGFEGVAGDDFTLKLGEPPSGGGLGSSEWLFIRGVKAGQEDLELVIHPAGSATGYVLLTEAELEPQPGDRPLLQLRIQGENGFFEWVLLHQPAFELRLNPGFYDLEFFVDPRVKSAGHMLVEQVEVASGMVTDLGNIELIRGEAEQS